MTAMIAALNFAIAIVGTVILRVFGVFNDRDHRKLMVIDGREAFVGGHCVVDGGVGTKFIVDYMNGVTLSVSASYLRVSALVTQVAAIATHMM